MRGGESQAAAPRGLPVGEKAWNGDGVAWKLSVIFWDVLETDTSALSKAPSCLLDSMKESRVILQLVMEPVVFVLEPDQHRRRFSVPRDDNAVLLREAEVLRELILDV
jgi:hypothetical protein